MKLVWHLVKFDLQRHRWSAAMLWAVAIAMPFLMLQGVRTADPDAISQVMGRTTWITVVSLAFVVVWLSLIATVIQGQPALGPRAGWVTRPISPWHMLGSRLLTVVLLAMLPQVVVQFTAMLVLGAPVVAALDVAVGTLLTLGLFALPVLLLAAVTSGLASFWTLLVGGVLLLSVSVSSLALGGSKVSGSVGGAKVFLAVMIAGAGSLALLTWLYRCRSARTGLVGSLGLLSVVLAVIWIWRWPIPGVSGSGTDRGPAVGAVPAEFKFEVPAAGYWVYGKVPRSDEIGVVASASAPAGAFRLRSASGRFELTGGGSIDAKPSRSSERMGVPRAVAAACGGTVNLLGEKEREPWRLEFITKLPDAKLERVVRFAGQTRCERLEWTNQGELPLRAGAVLERDAARLEVVDFGAVDGRLRVSLKTRVVQRRFMDRTAAESAVLDGVFVLVNRARSEAFVLDRATRTDSQIADSVPGFRFASFTLSVPRPSGLGDADGWLGGASLILVGERAVEAFDLPINFAMPEAPPKPRS